MTAMIKNIETGKFEDRSIEVLVAAVVAHYTKLGFYEHATALKEKGHALVEAGELTLEVLRDQPEEIKKEIGDVLVTVINWAHLEGVDFMEQYNDARILDSEATLSPDEACPIIHSEISRLGEFDVEISDLIETLHIMAGHFRTTLADCLGSAYDKVIARKVKIMSGGLVKEADWHKYPELEKVAAL